MSANQATDSFTSRTGRLMLAIAVSAVVAHYCVQVIVLILGGRPNFADLTSLAVNGGVTSLFLLIGWATRRVLLAGVCFMVIGLIFLTPFLFSLKGSWTGWLMQLATYVGLPLISTYVFLAVIKGSGVPLRGEKA